jgi:polysaccharide export outer membrane protein
MKGAVLSRRVTFLGTYLLGLWGLSVAMSLGASCATVQPRYDYASEPDPRKSEYVLGPSDMLKIAIWHNPDLSADATVRPDGAISLPLLGDLKAAGRTPSKLRDEIVQRLATFIKEESVTVTVAVVGINSYRFVVTGNVEHPGSYASSRYVTVVEALVMAGGPNRFANPDQTIIIRNDATKGTRRIPIDFPSILNGTHPEQDLTLLPGDTVYVP